MDAIFRALINYINKIHSIISALRRRTGAHQDLFGQRKVAVWRSNQQGGHRNNHNIPPTRDHISQPLTTNTQINDSGRNTFHPSRISWS